MLLNLKRQRKQKLYEKTCSFPGCDKTYFGIKVSLFCHEHKKQTVFRTDKSRSNYDTSNDTINRVETESLIDLRVERVVCALNGCCNEFDVQRLPRVFVYPKYCIEHRNEYRRELFIKQNKNI